MVRRAVVIGGLFAVACVPAVVGLVGNANFGDGLPVTVPPSVDSRLDAPSTLQLSTVSVPSEDLAARTISIVPAPTTVESTTEPSRPGDAQSGDDGGGVLVDNSPSWTTDAGSGATVSPPTSGADSDSESGNSGVDDDSGSNDEEPGGAGNGNNGGSNNGNGGGSSNGNNGGSNNGNGGGSSNGNGRGNGG